MLDGVRFAQAEFIQKLVGNTFDPLLTSRPAFGERSNGT